VLGYGLDDWALSPDREWEFFSSSLYPDQLWGPLGLLGTRGSFPEREIDHSLPSSAKVKNAWSYTSTPQVHLQGMVLS